jgi:hypothetical protein
MSNEIDNAPAIRDYLLGRLTEPEAEKIERGYFATPQNVDEIWAVFGDLAEEYLDGALSESDSRRFERRLDRSPAFHGMFENEKALRRLSAGPAAAWARRVEVTPAAPGVGRPSWSFRSLFVSPWRLALASVLALVALVLWLALRTRDTAPISTSKSPQTKTNDPRSPNTAGSPTPEPPRVPSPERREENQLAGGAKSPKEPKGGLKPGGVATFLFSGSTVRDGQPDPALTIPAETRSLRLEIDVTGDNCSAFSALLQTESEETLQRWENLRPRRDQSTPRVSLRASADALRDGVYRLRLACASRNEDPASGATYRFRLEKAPQ